MLLSATPPRSGQILRIHIENVHHCITHLCQLMVELDAPRPLESLEVDLPDPFDGDAVEDEARGDVRLQR